MLGTRLIPVHIGNRTHTMQLPRGGHFCVSALALPHPLLQCLFLPQAAPFCNSEQEILHIARGCVIQPGKTLLHFRIVPLPAVPGPS